VFLPIPEPILSALRTEIGADATLLGFVGSPWTLAAYAIEGKADKHCQVTKVRRCEILPLPVQSNLAKEARPTG
jgi:hypothetical protein